MSEFELGVWSMLTEGELALFASLSDVTDEEFASVASTGVAAYLFDREAWGIWYKRARRMAETRPDLIPKPPDEQPELWDTARVTAALSKSESERLSGAFVLVVLAWGRAVRNLHEGK